MKLEDARGIFDGYASDPETTRFMAFPTASGVEEVTAFLRAQKERFQNGESVMWAICNRGDGSFVGAIELTCIDGTQGEVGFVIDRAYWGRGIVTEALRAVLQFAKESLGLQRVRGRCDIENARSARVFEKLEFRDLGVAPKAISHPNVSSGMRDVRSFVKEL